MAISNGYYGTGSEVRFVNLLGTHRKRMQRLTDEELRCLLQRYIDAAERREDWGAVDKDEVVAVARDRLDNLDA